MAAICSAICSSSSSRFCGFPGKKSPNSAMKRSNVGLGVLARLPLLEHLVELGEHVLHRCHVLGTHVVHRAGHLVEVALHELLAELVDQLVEALPRLGRREVVVAQLADLPARSGGSMSS